MLEPIGATSWIGENMKLKMKQEEFLENVSGCHMKRFKAGTILNAEMEEAFFHGSVIPKKVFRTKISDMIFRFEEWEPGVFERIFEEC